MADTEKLAAEIVIQTRKAMEDVKAFVRNAKKELGNITANVGKKPGSGGSSSARSDIDRELEYNLRAQEKAARQREQAMRRANQQEVREFNTHQQRLMDAQQKALQTSERIESIHNTKLKAIARGLHVELLRITQAGSGATVSEIQAAQTKIQRILTVSANKQMAIIRGAAGAGGGIPGQGTPGGSKNFSKANMAAFQIQQIVEDFSFAGMRGASNNIALLASQIGGPAGLIALFATMGITLTPLIAKMFGFNDLLDEQAKAAKRAEESLRNLQRAREDLSAQAAGDKVRGPRELRDAMFGEADIQRRQREQEALRRVALTNQPAVLNAIRQAAQKDPERFGVRDPGINALQAEIKTHKESLGVYQMQEASLAKIVNRERELKQTRQAAVGLAGDDPAIQKIRTELREKELGLEKEIADERKKYIDSERRLTGAIVPEKFSAEERTKEVQEESLRLSEEIGKREVQIAQAKKDAAENAEAVLANAIKGGEAFDGVREAVLGANIGLAKQEEQLHKINDGLTVRQAAERAHETAIERANRQYDEQIQKLEKLLEDGKITHEEAVKQADALGKHHAAIVGLLENQKDIEKEKLHAAKEKLSIAKQEIKEQQKLTEELKKQATEQKVGFKQNALDVIHKQKMSHLDKEHQKALKQTLPQHPADIKFPWQIQQQQKLINQHFQKLKLQEHDQFMEKKGGLLMGQADAAGKAGNMEERRRRLMELQELQLGEASDTSRPGRAQAAFEAAKRTQQLIEQTFQQQQQKAQKELQLAQQEQQAAQGVINAHQLLANAANPAANGLFQVANAALQAARNLMQVGAGGAGGAGGGIGGLIKGLMGGGAGGRVAKMSGGGMVAGNPAFGDVHPALLRGGEVVLNQQQQYGIASKFGVPANRIFAAVGVPGFVAGPDIAALGGRQIAGRSGGVTHNNSTTNQNMSIASMNIHVSGATGDDFIEQVRAANHRAMVRKGRSH